VLNNHSYYSLRFGTLEPSVVLDLAEQLGYRSLALTDINCTAGIIEFARLALKRGVKPVVGIDFRKSIQQAFVALAKNNEGFAEMNAYLSGHLHAGEPVPARAPQWSNVFVVYPFARFLEGTMAAESLRENEFVGVGLRDVGKLRFSKMDIPKDKLVYLQPATFSSKRDFNAHRLLRAIDNNTLLSKLSVDEQADAGDMLYAPQHVREVLDEFAFAFDQSMVLLESCSIDFGFRSDMHKNLLHYSSSAEEDEALLLALCRDGLAYRYPDAGPQVLQRLEKELHLIREKKFVSYFLINWDIVNYARSKDYYYVGRGSGANSIVAYLLRITDVDPLELDLYFERFINLFRQSPPDFDIDFSWKEREDITRYIFEKFRNATLLGAFNTFQYSAVVRELGKVFGLPKADIDMLSDGKFNYDELDSMHQQVLRYAAYLKDFPNYISIHSAGILITEQPIYYFGATFLPPKGFPTVMFDMHQAEDIGINKLDILSQRGLGKIKDTLAIIQYNQPERAAIDIHDINRFKHDVNCNAMLQRGEALGCFYVESPAMRMLLTKLQTHNYIGLVAASSVIRPGVSSSGMMRTYIIRERIPERRLDAPEPMMRLMPETHGVMVYQEDVIKVAHEFAGLTLAEADVLRRGMSGKFRGREEFEHARNRFLQGALKKGHSETLVRDVWRQVESFAGYAFAKGHSASYAVESYQCLFLKAYFPLEYMTATINNFGGFFKTEIYVHEARMHGATIEAPCVNDSRDEAVIRGTAITLGLQMVKGLEQGVRESIVEARMYSPFSSLDDFLDRIAVGLEQSVLLARSGALRFTGMGKKELLWQLHFKLGKEKTGYAEQMLFTSRRADAKLPQLEHHWLEDAYDELELLGFPLCNPFQLIDVERLPEYPFATAMELKQSIQKDIHILGYKVALKPTGTSKGEGMFFGTFLDERGHFIDTVHFPQVAKAFPATGWGVFHIHGKVTEEFGAYIVEVKWIKRLDLLPDPRVTDGPSHPALLRKGSGNDRWVNRTIHGKPKLK
jgi:DNA polymerase-3 subunit alpha